MKRFIYGILIILAMFILSSCTALNIGRSGNVLKVEVSYLERIMLRPGSELTVKLLDGESLISSGTFELDGAPPYHVELSYEKKDIDDKDYQLLTKISYMGVEKYTSVLNISPMSRELKKEGVAVVLKRTEVLSEDLEDVLWELYSLGKEVVSHERKPYILLNSINNIVNGSTAMNSLSAAYELEGNNLVFQDIFVTGRHLEDYAQLEASYLEILKGTKHYEVYGDRLRLVGDNNETLAIFKKGKI